MGKIKTYNSREVIVTAGAHIVSGFAEDTFITLEQNGDGVTKKVGCDGEVARAVSPDRTWKLKLVLLQQSDSNSFFSNQYDYDCETGDGMFPLTIVDLKGEQLFSTEAAWVDKKASLVRGKDTNNREWEIDTGDGTLNE